ncbi:MAG: menaquinone biosynthesis protein [Pyrinomonadaceae bacterium]
MRFSASSYSNTAPLIWSFLYGSEHGKYEIILDNAPARSAELLAQKRVDCALVPVIEYQRIEDVLLVPDVCVGARERVRSVCLVTGGRDLKDVRSVALDVSSKTSVALTRIIFREFLGFDPVWRAAKPDLPEMLGENDCALLIGDPALGIPDLGLGISEAEETQENYRKFDLAELWRGFTGFGFVFAMWMAPESSLEAVRRVDFARIRDEGLAHLDEIIANYRAEIPLSHEEFRKYLTENISFSIDPSMREGLEHYYRLAHRHRLIDSLKPLKFIR